MATREDYEQLVAFSRIDGALVGLLWIASFAFFIGEFYIPVFSVVSLVVGLSSVVFAAMRLRAFRNKVLDGAISYRRAFAYSVMTYFNAALLMALAQYLYFQFIDGGFVISKYMSIVSTKEFAALAAQSGMSKADIQLAIGNLASLRPIDIAFQFLGTNMILGVIISLPVAFFIKSDRKINK